MLCKNKSINQINLWLKTIQQPPVLQAGADLKLSVSSVRKTVAECHHCVVITLEEYQQNRKINHVNGESSAAQDHANAHVLCCSNNLIFIYIIIPYLYLYHIYFQNKSHIFQKRHRLTGLTSSPSFLPPFPAALCSIVIIWSSYGDKKKKDWVTLLEGAKLKLAPNPTELFALISQSVLVIVEWRAAPSHLYRPLQHSGSMSQKYIKIVSMSYHKSKRWGFTSTHFLIKTVTQLWNTLQNDLNRFKIWRQNKGLD